MNFINSVIKVSIICLGKFKEKAYKELEKEYLNRLSPFTKLKVIELSEESYSSGADLDKVKMKEAQAIKKHIPKGSIVILMSENGTERDSVEFSKNLTRLTSLGQELVFVIGSGIGLHKSLNEVANYNFSLSRLTFTHNLARIILLEQIYRAMTISYGKEYHK